MKKTIIILMAACMLAACEKQIDIDIENQESKVVVQGRNEVGNPLSVDLTYSRPVFGNYYVYYGDDYFPRVTNATVTLSVDGGTTETATHNNGTYTFSHIPQSGEVLNLSISVPGRDEITATATVPQNPSISNIDTSYSNDMVYDYYAALQVNIAFTLNDQAATDDYYSIRLREVDTIIYIERDNAGNTVSQDTSIEEYYRFFECTDYLLVNNNEIDIDDPTASRTFSGTDMLFTDATINGMSHNVKLTVQYDYYWDDNNYYKSSDTSIFRYGLYMDVTALSRDLYLYRQTMNNYNDDELLSFFSEPVQIHSNINGGIGIFGVSSKTTKRIPIRQTNNN